jgi:signal transduction histidine kinase
VAGRARQCRFGLTFARIDDSRLTLGLVASDLDQPSSRAKKRFKAEPERRFSRKSIETAVANAVRLGPGVTTDFERSKEAALAQLGSNPEMARALAADTRQHFEETLNQSHDFLQLAVLIKGHVEAILKERYPQLSPVDAAERLPSEGAIYFSTELMLVKMDSLAFLKEINLVFGNETSFAIHPMLLKYVRIYRWQAEQKGLRVYLEGECYSRVRYNSRGLNALVQGLIDNMVKYAPADSEATIRIHEKSETIDIAFESLGPRIEDDERETIFVTGQRARAAQLEMTGLGLGLATAKQVSDALGLGLSVWQDPNSHPTFPSRHRTVFSFTVDRVS